MRDEQDLEAAGVLLLQGVVTGQQFQAGAAIGGPEVEDKEAVLKIAEFECRGLAVDDVVDGQAGCLLAGWRFTVVMGVRG